MVVATALPVATGVHATHAAPVVANSTHKTMADKLKKALEAAEKKIEKVEHDFRMYGHTAANPAKHTAAHQKKLAKMKEAYQTLLDKHYHARRKEQELYWENKQAADAAAAAAKKEKAAATRNANQAKKDEAAAARKAARKPMTEEEKEAKKAEEKSRSRRVTRSMKGVGRHRTRRR